MASGQGTNWLHFQHVFVQMGIFFCIYVGLDNAESQNNDHKGRYIVFEMY